MDTAKLEQRSKEWFESRRDVITGSRIGAILGLNPYQTAEDVMRDMVRDHFGYPSEFNGNIMTDYGIKNEPIAQAEFEKQHQMKVHETGLHKIEDWLGTSPDGLVSKPNDDEITAVLEIKCPFSKRNGEDFGTIKQYPHYHAQTQYEMYTTGHETLFFFQWSPFKTSTEILHIDYDFIERTIPKLKEFHERYLRIIKSADDRAPYLADKVKRKKPGLRTGIAVEQLGQEWAKAKKKADEWKSKTDDLRNAIIAACKEEETITPYFELVKQERKGAVDYRAIAIDFDLDIDVYRKEGGTAWVLKKL